MNKYIRQIDSMGRIVLPKEQRDNLNIRKYDKVLLEIEDRYIKISKYETIDDIFNKLRNILSDINAYMGLRFVLTNKNVYIETNEEVDINLKNEISSGKIKIYKIDKEYVIIPIYSSGIIIGSIIGSNDIKKIDDYDINIFILLQIFLNKYIED